MTATDLTPEMLAGAAALLLSLIFSYVPGLNTKFATLPEETRRSVMLGLVILLAAGAYGLACANILTDLIGVQMQCSQAGLLGLIRSVVVAGIVNQSTYKLSPQTAAVKALKANSGA